MPEKIRYVTRRKNKNGEVRFYWQRKGHPIKRLPDDEYSRNLLAMQYNAAADDHVRPEEAYPINSIGWIIDSYKNTDKYKNLADGTKRYYNRILKDVLDLGPCLPFALLDRGMVVDFIETYDGAGGKKKAAAVLRNLYNRATYKGIVPENLANNLNLASNASREIIWLPAQIDAFENAIRSHHQADSMKVAFHLHAYTAQRPSDVLNMKWSDYDGEKINCTQQKTGKFVSVPIHESLKQTLSEAQERATSPYIVELEQKQMSYKKFNDFFVEIRHLSGIGPQYQTRDLRRTAMVSMAEAGAEIQDIAAVSGHTIENTTQILETYLPRTYFMAQRAIQMWESKSDVPKMTNALENSNL